jgi:DNA-binding response OmpR family regulator
VVSVRGDTSRNALHELQSWSSRWWNFLFAPDERSGSAGRLGSPDRILIVEDDVLIATQMEAALTDAGFDVTGVARTGEQALELALARPPDLAVVDIRLAGDRNGVDTALELFRSHGIRCVFATAHLDREVRRRAEPAAPLAWLPKPYTMPSLTAVVRRAASELRDKKPRN